MRIARPVLPLLTGVLVAGLGLPASGAEEQAEQVTGVVTPYVREDGPGSDPVQVLDTGDELLPLVGTPLPEHAEVTVEVADAGDAYRVTDVLATAPAPPKERRRERAAADDGVHDVHVAFVLPRGATAADAIATPQQIRTAVAAVDEYWSSQTDGQVSFRLAGTLPAYASAYGCGGDGAWRMWEEADARFGGVRGTRETHLVLVLPRRAYTDLGCSYALGSVGSEVGAGGVLYVVDDTASAIAHELGHNLGLNHSGSLVCPDRQDAAFAELAGCAVTEYDDYLDVMSSSGVTRGTGALNAAHVDDLGLQPSSLVTVRGAGERTVRLSPLASRTGVRGVKVVVDAATSYFVQYRTRAGRDAAAPASYELGVEVHRGENPWAQPASFSATSSLALDTTPSEEEQGVTRALPVGETFESAAGGVEVEVLAQDSAGATVAVRVAPGAKAFSPNRATIEVPATVKANALFRPAVTVTDTDGRPVPDVDVRLQRRTPGTTTWSTVATATTSGAGRASVRARTAKSMVYRWMVPRTAAWASVRSPARQVRVAD